MLLIALPALMGGCALTPTGAFDKQAAYLHLKFDRLRSDGHTHRLFIKAGVASGNQLHIYFGGDGTPWRTPTSVARDPTPRQPLTLGLLAADAAPAVFIGRPCYHGQMHNCTPELWTTGRYSEPVVASMTSATRAVIARFGQPETTLVGYSGGGVLALLVAERLPEVQRVVTLAANLDIEKWAKLHGYLPLRTSINPADRTSWREDLVQIHLSGALDANVPPDNHARLHSAAPTAQFRQVADFTHTCCWVARWPALLSELVAARPHT